jgi:putative GTP pyrophosphokinase
MRRFLLMSEEAAEGATEPNVFDFDEHRRKAIDEYEEVKDLYEECSQAVRSVLRTVLDQESVRTLSVEARVKDVESFGTKVIRPSDTDPGQPRYPKPLTDITDLSGARVITFLLADIERVNELVEREFEVIEKSTMAGLFAEGQQLGYQSVHYLVKFSGPRCQLPEYERYQGRISEIQVRTILQHAWAEIEHDIQYKAETTIPDSLKRRFLSLAGVVEVADREFQAISGEDERIRSDVTRLVGQNRLDEVELTPQSLKVYLDKKYGPDLRMSDWSYGYAARVCKRLGFSNLAEVDEAISPYDDDQVSRALWGSRQGQLQRFEDVLRAAFGRNLTGAPSTSLPTWWLTRLATARIKTGTYPPQPEG